MRIGIDLGGTKIEIIALDDAGHTLARRRVATPQGDYAATLHTVAGLVDAVETELGRRGTVGVGTPGAVSKASGLMKNANSTCLNGQPLPDDLRRLLGREVRTANDANCLALSEAVDGAAAGAEVVFAVILGTGVGGGIVVRGQLLSGINSIAGEWGHNPLPLPAGADLPLPACYCGRAGCIETYLSGPGLAADHLRSSGVELAPEAMVAAALDGDAACEASLQRYEARLARALAGVINILDPDVVVLGGGLSNVDRLYERVPTLWAPHVFSDSVATRMSPALHGDSSGVRGAAWLWPVAGQVWEG
ncbi:ROK family protein [Zoogloea sp.]|uniref:ROK family protein n=1 Tax=Zoogloea sp. TaxID=49181 RepID=UPI0035AF347E